MTTGSRNLVLCVGLTPAVQELREFTRLAIGGVNRPLAVRTSAAGKGVNVAHVLRTLGGQPVLLGFIGGDTGRMVMADLARWKVHHRLVPVQARTRTCHTLLDRASGEITELVQECDLPPSRAWAELKRRYRLMLPQAALITVSGALMPGAPPGIYRDMVAAARRQARPVIIDSQKAPLLQALTAGVFLAKLNRHELENTVERRLPTPRALIRAARELVAAGAQHVLVTDGARGAWLITEARVWQYDSPRIRAVNPIGSGDAVTAGLAYALGRRQPLPDAVRLGIACGTANALTITPGTLTRTSVARLLRRVRCREP